MAQELPRFPPFQSRYSLDCCCHFVPHFPFQGIVPLMKSDASIAFLPRKVNEETLAKSRKTNEKCDKIAALLLLRGGCVAGGVWSSGRCRICGAGAVEERFKLHPSNLVPSLAVAVADRQLIDRRAVTALAPAVPEAEFGGSACRLTCKASATGQWQSQQ